MSENIPVNFTEIEYDLARNLLNFEEKKVVSLKHHSFILFIAQKFKETYKNDLLRWLKAQKKYQRSSSCDEVLDSWENFQSRLHSEIQIYEENISKDPISFMALQVYDIIIKHESNFKTRKFQDVILRNLYFTCHGTINISKTVERILKTTPIGISKKFIFICTEPECMSYHRYNALVPNRCKSGEGYLKFWKEKCLEMKNDSEVQSITKSSFQKAIENNNEIAVQFIWKEYISKMEDKRKILETSLKKMKVQKSINIFMYLILQEKTTTLNIFRPYSLELITESIKNLRWRPLSLRIFSVFKGSLGQNDKFKIISVLSEFYKIDYIAKPSSELLRDYFESFNENEQKYIAGKVFEHTRLLRNTEESILESFIDEREDFVKMLLKAGNDENTKKFFTSTNGFFFFLRVVEENKLEFVSEILKFHFKEGITDLKREILKSFPRHDKEDFKEIVRWCKSEK